MKEVTKPFLSFTQKIFIIIFVMAVTLLYSSYEKNIYDKLVNKAPELILKEMPTFEVVDVDTKQLISKETFSKDPEISGIMVHFWGTWCAPCEAELPSFIELANKLEEENIKVLILAVNDQEMAVKKFLRRFKNNRSKNILFGLDKDGLSLPLFGSVKVPETYLFSNKFRHLEKFVGPQDWAHQSYFDRVVRLITAVNKNNSKTIETH